MWSLVFLFPGPTCASSWCYRDRKSRISRIIPGIKAGLKGKFFLKLARSRRRIFWSRRHVGAAIHWKIVITFENGGKRPDLMLSFSTRICAVNHQTLKSNWLLWIQIVSFDSPCPKVSPLPKTNGSDPCYNIRHTLSSNAGDDLQWRR